MKMKPVTTPPESKLDDFVAMIHASMPVGLTSGPALQRKRAIGSWLMRLGDWLPPELANRGLTCYSRGRGVMYQTNIVAVAPHVSKAATTSESKVKAKAAKKAPVSPSEWRAVADRISARGTMPLILLSHAYSGTPTLEAIKAHPDLLPPELARLGITFDPVSRTYSGL